MINSQKLISSAMLSYGEDVNDAAANVNTNKLSEKITFLTRALAKNNIVKQNLYLVLMTMEYITMMYYILRLADIKSLQNGFTGIENFLNVQMQGGLTYKEIGGYIGTNSTISSQMSILMTQILAKSNTHVIINCIICGVVTLFFLLLFHRLFNISNFDQTQDQSYVLRMLSCFMVLAKTILVMPVLISMLIVIKILTTNLVPNLFSICLICNAVLIVEFTFVVVYSLKFFNIEVPNDDIAWSHNQTSGIYLKLVLKIALCSQELYREQLNNVTVSTIILAIIIFIEVLILMYRMNSPNIFNSLVHDYTLLLESLMFSLSVIGIIALFSQRDIMTTLAYLCIFIPVFTKIIYSVDQDRKHRVLFKLKNEESLSSNEYLISITHLLKMIKRQSETDLAQLLSFTYYHKLTCYDTQCICQFFTHYCQEPQKFRAKKKRIYRGFIDNGYKLILQQQENEFHDNDHEGFEQQTQQKIIKLMSLHSEEESKNAPGDNTYTIQPSKPPQRQQQNPENVQDIAADNNMQEANDEGFINNQEEQGIMTQLQKGNILKGNAFNGFDSNMDFKLKNEFKSPSQFKNIKDSQTYFFTRLLETMFKQLELRTNKNTSYQLISIYFHFAYQHNIYLAALNLVKLSNILNRSSFQKMAFSLTEYYLLELILNEFKHHTKDEINYSVFIEQSQKQQRLDWLCEETSHNIISFWRIFKEDQANVKIAYQLAMIISKNISLIRDHTSYLEERYLIKDYNKYYYYAMFYQNLLNDRQTYNDIIDNLKNLLIKRNMLQKLNGIGSELSQDINDVGFSIFSIDDNRNGLDGKSIGRFLCSNKSACEILNISEEDIIGKPASMIMPELIRVNHETFVKRFMQDGLTRNIGKVRNAFVRDFRGYIKPVQFFINFYYTSRFSYSFIMHLDQIQSLTYYGTQTQINIKNCMFFLCNDNNVIKNMTENVCKLLGLTQKRVKEEEEILGRDLRIEDIIKSFFNIETVIQDNKLTYLPNQKTNIRKFLNDSNSNMNSSGTQYIPCTLTYEETNYLIGHPSQYVEKIYLVIPMSNVPLIDFDLTASSQFNTQPMQKTAEQINGEQISNSVTCDSRKSLSIEMHSSKSSQNVQNQNIRNPKNRFFKLKSPKILTLYLTIVFLVLFSFILVTSVNYGIYIYKKNSMLLQIQANQIINQRNNYLASTIFDLKQMHLISQAQIQTNVGNMSNIFDGNRFDRYGLLFLNDENILQTNQQEFKQLNLQSYQKNYNELIVELQVKMISSKGNLYYDNCTLDFAIQLMIADMALIKPQFFIQEQLPMNLDSILVTSNNNNKSVSQFTKNLYYIYSNGLYQINHLTSQENKNMNYSVLDQSQRDILFINLISFLSIGIITFIGIFTFPMLGKIEDRKISVLKFFNLLSIDQIAVLIKKGEQYRDEFQALQKSAYLTQEDDKKEENEQINYQNALDDSEKVLTDIKQVQFNIQNNNSENEKIGKQMKQSKFKNYVKNRMKKKLGNKPKSTQPSRQNGGIQSMFLKIKENEENNFKEQNSFHKNVRSTGSSDSNATIQQKKTMNMMQDEEIKKENESLGSFDENDDGAKIKKGKKGNKKQNLHALANSNDQEQEVVSNKNRLSHINEQLDNVALKEKFKLALYVFIVLIFLNSCLIGCFIIGRQTFQQETAALLALTTFYHRQNCIDNLMLYSLEQFIQNKTIYIDQTESNAVLYYLNYCQQHELDYNALRVNLPNFLQNAQSIISNMESSNLCKTIYQASDIQNITNCEESYNKVMQLGLTSALYTIYNYATTMNVQFMNQTRSSAYLNQTLYNDQNLRDLTDLMRGHIHDAFQFIQGHVTSQVNTYFNTLASNYTIVYSCYMSLSVVLFLIFCLFFFKKLRQQIITSSNILSIMPLEELQQKDRLKIEAFLNS